MRGSLLGQGQAGILFATQVDGQNEPFVFGSSGFVFYRVPEAIG